MIGNQAQNLSTEAEQIVFLPRINVVAFFDNAQSMQAAQAASQDRRASKAHFTVNNGGIMGAARAYVGEATPNVLIVESNGQREQVLGELASLAEVCSGDTKVIVVGHVNDVILYRELIRQGISEYLVAPVSPLQIIETVAGLFNDPKAAPLGKILAFVGVKGGVGSSTIAHNVAWYLSQKHSLETVLTDLDLAFGTASLNFNQEGNGGGINEALSQSDRLDTNMMDRLMTKLGDRLNLLNSAGGVEREFSLEGHAVESVLHAVRGSAPMIVVDVPNVWAPWVKHTLLSADEIIITATPELPSLRNAKGLIDMLKAQRQNDRMPKLVISQAGMPKRPEIPAADFAKALGMEPIAIIPHDPHSFGTAQGNGQMLAEVAPKAKATEIIAGIAEQLIGNRAPIAAKKSSGSILDKLSFLNKKKSK